MKVRFFRVIWVLSVLWLGLLLYLGISSDREDQLLMNLFFALPSAVGLIATYVATGTFFWPRDDSPWNGEYSKRDLQLMEEMRKCVKDYDEHQKEVLDAVSAALSNSKTQSQQSRDDN